MIWLLLFFGFGSLDSGGPTSPEQAAMDLGHLELRLRILPQKQQLEGEAVWQIRFPFSPPDRLEFDLVPSLEVQSASIDNRPVRFERKEDKLWLIPNAPLATAGVRVRIAYKGAPFRAKRPPWEGGFCWDHAADDSAWLAVCCQGEGAKVWFPSKDRLNDKIEGADLIFTIPEELSCVSNGFLVAEQVVASGWKAVHWRTRYPIAPYNISLNIGTFERLSTLGSSCPIEVYFQRCSPDSTAQTNLSTNEAFLARTASYIAWLEAQLGPYPFAADKICVVESPYLGMEHQTLVSYGNPIAPEQDFPFNFDETLFHELGHEWFGNRISSANWGDFWLQEGLATYLHALFLEDKFDLETAHEYMKVEKRRIKNRRPIQSAADATASEAYHDDIYIKTAWVLHGLRQMLGREVIGAILRAWATDPRWSYNHFATAENFYATVEKIAGRDYRWYFKAYIEKAQLPKIIVERHEQQMLLTWSEPGFEVPLEIERIGVSTTRFQLPMTHGKGSFDLGVDEVYRIDPEGWILRDR